jgi:hypothetical protein
MTVKTNLEIVRTERRRLVHRVSDWSEWREDKESLGWFNAPQGLGLLSPGFQPWEPPPPR